jgi:hypothetical protein
MQRSHVSACAALNRSRELPSHFLAMYNLVILVVLRKLVEKVAKQQ